MRTVKKLKPKDNLDVLSDAEETTETQAIKKKKKVVMF
jgi:hypothetical protein